MQAQGPAVNEVMGIFKNESAQLPGIIICPQSQLIRLFRVFCSGSELVEVGQFFWFYVSYAVCAGATPL